MGFGKEPVVLVDLIQDFCDKEYGVTCNAVLGTTGDNKCFNTFRTCQDAASYSKVTDGLTLRFCRPMQQIPLEWNAIPSLSSVDIKPTLLNIGGASDSSGALGERGMCTIQFQDHPDGDIKTDPYLSDRAYDPYSQGTFWTKWLARNVYYKNRIIKVRQGYIDQTLDEMKISYYVIDRVQGPNSKGMVTVKGVDILRLVDNDKVEIPEASTGELLLDLNETATTFYVANADITDYPSSGTVRIGDEIVTYTSITDEGTYLTFSGVTRATDGSEVDEHDAEERVQKCLRYIDQFPHDVAYDLIVNEGPVPSQYIDYTAWDDEASVWLPQFQVTTLISEPTGAQSLLSSLTKECMFYIWWDERVQLINLRAVRPPDQEPVEWSIDGNILEGSQQYKEDSTQRVSRVKVYYQPKNWAEDLDKESNFKKLRLSLDLSAESVNEYDDKKVESIYCRFIKTNAQALNVGERYLARYRDTPKFLSVQTDGDDRDTWTADIVNVTSDMFVNFIGEQEKRQFQVISAMEQRHGEIIQYELQSSIFIGGKFAFYMADDAPLYINATEVERRAGAWYADVDGLLPDGSPGYTYQ